jgi:hypothetical protein
VRLDAGVAVVVVLLGRRGLKKGTWVPELIDWLYEFLMGAYCVRLLMVQLVLRVNPVPAIPVRLGKIFWAVMLV